MLRRVFRQKQFLVCVALLALICLVSKLTVNFIQDRTAMTLLHTLCYVAMIPIFGESGKSSCNAQNKQTNKKEGALWKRKNAH